MEVMELMVVLSKETTFDDLRKLMENISFKEKFYRNIVSFRDKNNKVLYKSNLSNNIAPKGVGVVDTFCVIFCDLKEYTERVLQSNSYPAIKRDIARALVGISSGRDPKDDEIDDLRTCSSKYNIGQFGELLKEFLKKKHYLDSEIKNISKFDKCVEEFIDLFNDLYIFI
ncbi:MAG: hypothetical protein K0S25_132 [Bacillus sp. (in: firmicutes)]|jgi:hypothetical protein|nr:hypothetical protein [Neobacillus sp.]MDF2902494.1 hypothetical protein [Bacillus sp. (in: firmicutes)]